MSIEGKPVWKWAAVYLGTILLGYVLFAAVWGGTGGLLIGSRLAFDPKVRAAIDEFIGKEAPTTTDPRRLRENLPEDKRRQLDAAIKERFKEVNWLSVHLATNIITFGILGSITGLFMFARYSAVIPAAMSFLTLRVLSAEEFVVHSKPLTISLGLFTQIVMVYTCSFATCWIRKAFRRRV